MEARQGMTPQSEDDSREYLVRFCLENFRDKTFEKYIRQTLAGDFAFNLANSLKSANFMPSELTAENGAKRLLLGEFSGTIEISNPDYCGCDIEECNFCRDYPDTPETILMNVPVDWTTIKDIYRKIVDYYSKIKE